VIGGEYNGVSGAERRKGGNPPSASLIKRHLFRADARQENSVDVRAALEQKADLAKMRSLSLSRARAIASSPALIGSSFSPNWPVRCLSCVAF